MSSGVSSKKAYRTIFISDVHIGSRDAHLHKLSEFLKSTTCENLILVGDIIDLWMGKGMKIDQPAISLIRKLMKRCQNGTNVIYIPGNHDEILRTVEGIEATNFKVCDQYDYQTLDGRKFLVIHGDQFDRIILNNKWLAHLGAACYDWLVVLNRLVSRLYRALGKAPRSLSAYMRNRVKMAVKFIGNFEDAVTTVAKQNGYDGVICGHIHTPDMREIQGVLYVNCGDWLEHCTAVVETLEGKIEILYL